MLTFLTALCVLLFIGLLAMAHLRSKAYWSGRNDGWASCEAMVVARIGEHYPENRDMLWSELLQ